MNEACMYVIVAIHLDPVTHYVDRVFWGEATPGKAGWKAEPLVAEVAEVISAIEQGSRVETALSVGGCEVAMRGVRVSTDKEGRKFLCSRAAGGCRALALFDLPAL